MRAFAAGAGSNRARAVDARAAHRAGGAGDRAGADGARLRVGRPAGAMEQIREQHRRQPQKRWANRIGAAGAATPRYSGGTITSAKSLEVRR